MDECITSSKAFICVVYQFKLDQFSPDYTQVFNCRSHLFTYLVFVYVVVTF